MGVLVVLAGSLNLRERGLLCAHTVCFNDVVKHLWAESEHELDTELVIRWMLNHPRRVSCQIIIQGLHIVTALHGGFELTGCDKRCVLVEILISEVQYGLTEIPCLLSFKELLVPLPEVGLCIVLEGLT